MTFLSLPLREQIRGGSCCRHWKSSWWKGIPFICMQTSLNSWGTSSTTEENRYALASARCLVIMHRDLFDLDSQGGNWFYNLKQACTYAVIEAGETPRMHARFHMRAAVALQITFPDWRSMPTLELVPLDSNEPTPYYIKREALRRCLSNSSCPALLSNPRIEIPDPLLPIHGASFS